MLCVAGAALCSGGIADGPVSRCGRKPTSSRLLPLSWHREAGGDSRKQALPTPAEMLEGKFPVHQERAAASCLERGTGQSICFERPERVWASPLDLALQISRGVMNQQLPFSKHPTTIN